jgi:hypothetical protein
VEVEVYSIRVGPDGLAKISVRTLCEPVSRSWLVPARDAEDAVLDRWAERGARLSAELVAADEGRKSRFGSQFWLIAADRFPNHSESWLDVG